MYERDRQTDTHRDRWTLHDGTGRACIASHGKNDKNCQIQLVDCNSLLYGTTERNLNRLQKVECDSSHVHQAFFQTSATALRQQLHWLPIRQRIKYKLATLTFREKYYRTSLYLHE